MSLFEKVPRSIAKTVVYQGTMALITFAVALAFTGRLDASLGIAAVNNGSKSIIYYFHERAWARLPWGYRPEGLGGRRSPLEYSGKVLKNSLLPPVPSTPSPPFRGGGHGG